MEFKKPTTEKASKYDHLEEMNTKSLLSNINSEDKSVPFAVEKEIPRIEKIVDLAVTKMRNGGRIFYIGAGTSGRLGVLDASECPPTFGVPDDRIIGIIAGGDIALRKAVEHAEDDTEQAWEDMRKFSLDQKDMVIGIAASGTTPYVVEGVRMAREKGISTACITCNSDSPLAREAELPIECIVGPEFVTGSTRMKAGTAQKMILNMISTSIMIKMGRVKGNRMVDMQLSNEKLVKRGVEMIMEELQVQEPLAKNLLKEHGSVRKAVNAHKEGKK